MNSEEIKAQKVALNGFSTGEQLTEIAYQLALLNEKLDTVISLLWGNKG